MNIPFNAVDNNATIGATEYSLPAASTTLTAQTNACTLQAFIDFSNMVAGDQYRVRVYESINGGSQLVVWESVVTGVQPGPLVTPSFLVKNGWNVTVQKLAGTDRVIKWDLKEDGGDRNALLLRWLTDNAGGTPNALTSGRVEALVGAMAADVLTAAATAADFGTEVANAVWNLVSEGTEKFGDTIRLIAARLFGKGTVQDGDGSYVFRDKADTKDRIAMTRTGTARTVTTRDGT